tara:strand:+ start:108 stop:1400 length:1293 start_codon:yes stop_codon:yes gene_type:complete
MANRKILIESILGLAQKIGANPNKFMGTKQNINFLGTGDRGMRGTTFSAKINDDFLNMGFTQDDLVKIIEQDAGFVTAGKLNDVQLNTMFNNLKKIDEAFNPPPGPMNVIDLRTGTGNLNKEGLESLRIKDMSISDRIGEGIKSIKTKFTRRTGRADDAATKAKSEQRFYRTGAADMGDEIESEGARRAVVRQVLAKDPDFFMLPPETTESIVKFKDLQRGGADFPDPLVVFRNVGNFNSKELAQIDNIIAANPFDDVKVIADKVSEYIKLIRPEGFRPGFRSGKSVQGLLNLINKRFGKDTLKVADEIERPASAKLSDEFAAFNERNIPLTETLTQNEIRYLTNFIDDTGGGKFVSDIMEEVPSLRIIGNKISLDKKDVDNFSNFLEVSLIERGVDKMPPRLRDTHNNLLIKLLRSEKAKGGLARILEM